MEQDFSVLKWRMDVLFRKGRDDDLADDILHVSDYYSYLANSIDQTKPDVTADKELVESFESIYLWLQDKLLLYPESIRNQVADIIRTKELCEVFAILSNLPEDQFREIRRAGMFERLPKIYSFLKWLLPPLQNTHLTLSRLFETKMALRRLAQIVKFASSLDVVDYDETLKDFKNNYDPNLIDKHKLFAMISYLRVEVSTVPH